MQCGQFAFVCMYVSVCICIYPSHFKCVGTVFVVSVNHFVLVLPGWSRGQDGAGARMEQGPGWSRGHLVLVRSGGDQRVKKITREPKWSRSGPSVIMLESESGNKGTLHQKRVRQGRKNLTD